MNDLPSDRKKKLEKAMMLFNHLLQYDNPPEVQKELRKEIELCEEEIEKIRNKDIQGVANIDNKNHEDKIEYVIWTRAGKGDAAQTDIDELKVRADIFIDDDNKCVYTKGKVIEELAKSTQGYNSLVCVLENKGKATPEKIFSIIFPKNKTKKEKKIRDAVRVPIFRLRRILKNRGLGNLPLKVDGYRLVKLDEQNFEKSIDFVLARKNKPNL